jgi:hypothetical protein
MITVRNTNPSIPGSGKIKDRFCGSTLNTTIINEYNPNILITTLKKSRFVMLEGMG